MKLQFRILEYIKRSIKIVPSSLTLLLVHKEMYVTLSMHRFINIKELLLFFSVLLPADEVSFTMLLKSLKNYIKLCYEIVCFLFLYFHELKLNRMNK